MSTLLPPPPEFGIHFEIFKNALRLKGKKLTADEAVRELHRWKSQNTFRPGRDKGMDSEIREAVRNAYKLPSQPRGYRGASTGAPMRPQWPAPSPDKRASAIAEIPGFGLYDLWEKSPWKPTVNRSHTRELLEWLFPGDPLLCCGKSPYKFDTRHLSEWADTDLSQWQFIVPSPMIARQAMTTSGKLSAHTLKGTGPRRVIVIDFDDFAGLDIHAAAAWALGELLPLVMVLKTGGKGLHAWYAASGRSEAELRVFFRLGCTFGGDPLLWTRSQFVRMPDGFRDNGEEQRVIYFNRRAV